MNNNNPYMYTSKEDIMWLTFTNSLIVYFEAMKKMPYWIETRVV